MKEDTLLRRKSLGERQMDVGKWVGAMGFSQGTRVVGGLLRWMEKVKEVGTRHGCEDIDVRFGVLCMGSAEPMGMSYAGSSLCSSQGSFISSLPVPAIVRKVLMVRRLLRDELYQISVHY